MSEEITEHLPASTLKISKNLLASKEKPINNTDKELWHKATFGDEPETKNNPETDKDNSGSSIITKNLLVVERYK